MSESTGILSGILNQQTGLSDSEKQEILQRLDIRSFPKGTILLREGQSCRYCYFILKGCIREYRLDGNSEHTSAFYTEQQAAAQFLAYSMGKTSDCYWECTEDCELVVGNLEQEAAMYDDFPALKEMTRKMMETDFGTTQEAFARFRSQSPEERYLDLLENRPDLLQRVPQHQLASMLGITPESLSRIRKRLTRKG